MRKDHWESFYGSFVHRSGNCSVQLYRLRLGNNPIPEIFVEGLGSEHIDGNSQQISQSVPDLADVEDRCLRSRAYQYVEVTLFRVFPRRTEPKTRGLRRSGKMGRSRTNQRSVNCLSTTETGGRSRTALTTWTKPSFVAFGKLSRSPPSK